MDNDSTWDPLVLLLWTKDKGTDRLNHARMPLGRALSLVKDRHYGVAYEIRFPALQEGENDR